MCFLQRSHMARLAVTMCQNRMQLYVRQGINTKHQHTHSQLHPPLNGEDDEELYKACRPYKFHVNPSLGESTYANIKHKQVACAWALTHTILLHEN